MNPVPTAQPVGVLVVDDHVEFRSVAKEMLDTAAEFAVVGEAASAEEAIEFVARARPGLVLMDVRLGDVDGIEATRRILEIAPRTVVVLVSTYQRADLSPDVDHCGAVRFLPKDKLEPDVLGALFRPPPS
jgi:DNA-binding NarL/FixJ family response regulator